MTAAATIDPIASKIQRELASIDKSCVTPADRIEAARRIYALGMGCGNAQGKLSALQKAVKLDPFKAAFRKALAQAEVEHGLWDAAITEYNEMLKFWPDERTSILLAEAMLDKGEVAKARECFSTIGEQKGEAKSRLEFDLVECDLRDGNFKEALARLEKIDISTVQAAALLYEKCLKLVLENPEQSLIDRAVNLVKTDRMLVDASSSGETYYDLLGLTPGSLAGVDDKKIAEIIRNAASGIKRKYGNAAQRGDKEAEEMLNKINEAVMVLKNPETRKEYKNAPVKSQFPEELKAARALVLELASGDGTRERNDGDGFEGLLASYKLSRTLPISAEENLPNLATWKVLLESSADPTLQVAYIALLDNWARTAYKSKNLDLAKVLWEEAARLEPYNPGVLHNLAVLHTRQQDETGYQWYWDKTIRSWVLHSEMLPEADGYKQELIQKHRAFTDGAEAKLQTMKEWQDFLELGSTWIKEAIAYFSLHQLEYRNPYFILGIQTSDFTGEKERLEVIRTGYESMRQWLEWVALWEGLGKDSELAKWRMQRLAAALEDVKEKKDHYRFYEQERKSFIHHREYITKHFLNLLFRLLGKVADGIDINAAGVGEKYALLISGLMSFPHALIKPGVLKAVEQLPLDTDLHTIIQNQAAAPWAKRAQEFMKQDQFGRALPLLEQMMTVVPDFVPGMFLLAQCHAQMENFDQAYKVVSRAKKLAKPDDEIQENIEKFSKQMDMARINKRLRLVQEKLKQEDAEGALDDCEQALLEYPNHPYVLFVMAQAYIAKANVPMAIQSLSDAQKHCMDNEDLLEAIKKNLDELKKHAPQVILSRAVPPMQANNWYEALEYLEMGRDLKPPDARVTFYEAICLAKLGREDEAEKTSKTALAQAKEDPKLKEEIENFIPQIAMAAISEQLSNARKAMDQSNWAEAISYLEEAETISPKTVLVLFYLTVCHFRLEHWSEAQEYALAALLLCKEKNKEIKEQLNIILEQLDIAPIKDELDKAQKAIQGEHWNAALPHIDSVLLIAPENPVALFFQALCYFKLERWDEAEESAREALRHTNKKEHENIESQLNTLLKNLVGARKAKSIGPIVELINKGNLSGALKKVEKALEEDSYNPDLHFFRAVCTFRQTMDSINSKKVTPSTSMFDDIDYDLSIAESSSDYSVSSQAASLKNNVENVKQQIRSAGYW